MTASRSQPSDAPKSAVTDAQPSAAIKAFTDQGDFAAYHRATDWLKAEGYSVGRMQAHSPTGILRGDYDIQKWRNLRPSDRAALDGTLTGNFRDGPVFVRLRAPLPTPQTQESEEG